MRIAYLSSHYPAVSHTFIQREVRALRGLGVDVRTCTIWRAGAQQILSDADGAEAESTFAILPRSAAAVLGAHRSALLRHPRRYLRTLLLAQRVSPPGVRARLWRLFYFAEAVVLREQLRREGVRHVHAQFADGATDVAMLVAHFDAQDGATWSLMVHGPVEFYDVTQNALRHKVRRALFVLAISDFGRSQLMTLTQEHEWEKLHVVHCGIDPAAHRLVERGSDGGPMRILSVGRLVHLKGHSLLLEAVAELRRRGIPVEATIVGEGPKRAEIEALVRRLDLEAVVRLPGSLGQQEVRDQYARADVFCLASFAEGVPVVLMEAMASALPVVTTRIMGIPELVEDGVSGLLIPPGRADDLVTALERLSSDAPLRRRLGEAGRRKVVEDFNVARSAERLRGILRRTLPAG